MMALMALIAFHLALLQNLVVRGDEQRAVLSAVQKALDVANEKIRQLEACQCKADIALTKSKKKEAPTGAGESAMV